MLRDHMLMVIDLVIQVSPVKGQAPSRRLDENKPLERTHEVFPIPNEVSVKSYA